MRRALVIFATKHGHTGRIAARIADELKAAEIKVDLLQIDDAAEADPLDYDLVVVGASLHAGQHQREIVEWAGRHAGALNLTPSGFFSVSLTAAEDSEEAREVTAGLVQDFIEETGWHPSMTATLAGALQYLEYDFFTRLLMRTIARRHGQETDAGQDVDYTDWDEVGRFAESAAALPARSTKTAGR